MSSSPPSSSSSDDGSPTSPSTRKPSPSQPKRPQSQPQPKHNPLNRWGPKVLLEGGKEQMRKAQQDDPSLADCRRSADKKDGPFSYESKLFVRSWQPPHEADEMQQMVLPRQYRETTVRFAHFSPFAGHFGKRKTTHRVMRTFFWPGMRRDIADACRACEVCQKTARRRTPKFPLLPLPVVDQPFSRIAMDMVGPLPPTSQGHKFILTM